MTTIHPLGLAKAIADDKTFELLDVRSRKEFERGHIRGARSAPLRALQAARLVHERGLTNPAPLFLVSDRQPSASLAAGMLRAAGCVHPVVLEGGMHLWEAQGLPVVRPLRRHATTVTRWLGDTIRSRVLQARDDWKEVVRSARARSRRPDNAWWYRRELQPREAYRG